MRGLIKIRNAAEDISDLLDLPAEALAGSIKISVVGGRNALIENHSGLLAFSESEVVVSAHRGKVVIRGSGLCLGLMTARQLSLSGKIQHVELEQ